MSYVFGEYVLDPDRRELRHGAEPVAVEPRVFDLLEYLIRQRDRVVSKDDLIEHVWNGTIVSESALLSRMNAARRAIGDDGVKQVIIRTVQRKGYRFVGSVQGQDQLAGAGARPEHGAERPFALPEKPSIVVLPFVNLSVDPGQDYFADGMVEDITVGLSRISWLFVIARNSSNIYKNKDTSPLSAAKELGVRYVLDGSVRKSAERVRINAWLVEAHTGVQLWSERFDATLDDIFSLQDDISLKVVGAIEPKLRDAEVERIRRNRPDSLDAYDLLMQAHPLVYSRMPRDAAKALALVDRAVSLAPGYALAHAYASACHHCLFFRDGLRETHRAASLRHADAAIRYGQSDSVALTFAGFALGMEGKQTQAAIVAFEAALSVSPSSALTYILGSMVLAIAGDGGRAIEWSERGLRLSPFDPMRSSAYIAMSVGHYRAARFEQAVDAARWAVQFSPGFSVCHLFLAAALVQLGLLNEARTAAGRVLELQPSYSRKQLAATGYAPELFNSLYEALRLAGLPE